MQSLLCSRPALTSTENALDVSCSCIPSLLRPNCMTLGLHPSPSLVATHSALHGNGSLLQMSALILDPSPSKTTSNECLDLDSCSTKLSHLLSCDHTNGMALDIHCGSMPSKCFPDKAASHVPLNSRRRFVKFDPANMIGPPPRLNHCGCDPSCDKPI